VKRKTGLVGWLHHHSYILCFITLVTNHVESKIHQMIWFQSGKYTVVFIWESIQNFSLF